MSTVGVVGRISEDVAIVTSPTIRMGEVKLGGMGAGAGAVSSGEELVVGSPKTGGSGSAGTGVGEAGVDWVTSTKDVA
jgi:hypothetical protein